MALKDYPPIYDGTTLPFFPEADIDPKEIAKTFRSEGGHDIKQSFRKDKWSISVKTKLADDEWVAFFYGLSLGDGFVYQQYSPLLHGYTSRNVRMENFKFKQVKDSEVLTAVNGVWEVSFTLEEF
jgi:hypothetical protein